MKSVGKLSCKTSSFGRLRTGAFVLGLSLLLMLTTLPVAASAHTQNAQATAANLSSQTRIKHVTELGTFDFGGIVMSTAKEGWTFTDKVQHTTDGGKTWQIVAQGNAQEYIGALEIWDEQIAWYLAYDVQTYAPSALYRTTDGGQNWTRFAWVDASQYMSGISILDGQDSWVTTSDSNGAYHLYLVGEASQNWQEVTLPGPDAGGAFFISKKVGWVTASTPGDFNSTATLYATRDGGQTWQQQNLAIPAGTPANAIVTRTRFVGFGDDIEGYMSVTLGDSASYAQYATQIYRTVDGGLSWQPYSDPQPTGPNPGDNITLITQIDGWHPTAAGFIIMTGPVGLGKLQGGHWTIQHVTLPPNGYFLTVLNDREMFVSNSTSDNTAQDLYKTEDGGATWQHVATVAN